MDYSVRPTPASVRKNQTFNYYNDREYWSVYFLKDVFKFEFSVLHGLASREQAEEVGKQLTYYFEIK